MPWWGWMLIILAVLAVIGIIIAIVVSVGGNDNGGFGDSCSQDSDCQSGYVCSNGTCLGAIGASCTQNSDCQSNNCNSSGLCDVSLMRNGASCQSSDQCISGNCGNGVCRPSGGSPIGFDCSQNSDCASGMCALGKCVAASNPPVDPSDPGSGFMTDFFSTCNSDSDCNIYNICSAGLEGSAIERCLFRPDPNVCPTSNGVPGGCLPGFICSESQNCLGASGLSCVVDQQCQSGTCSITNAISVWNGSTWTSVSGLTQSLSPFRLVATGGSGGNDNLYLLDLQEGIYYRPGGPSSTFSQIIDAQSTITVPSGTFNTEILDFDVTSDNMIYTLLSGTSAGTTSFFIQMIDPTNPGEATVLFNGSALSDVSGNSLGDVTNLTAVKQGDTIGLAVTAQPSSGGAYGGFFGTTSPMFVRGMIGTNPYVLLQGAKLRYIEDPALPTNQAIQNFNQLSTINGSPASSSNPIEIQSFGDTAFAGQGQGQRQNDPIGAEGLTIIDYDSTLVTSGSLTFTNVYLLARNTDTNDVNLYMNPGAFPEGGVNSTFGTVVILPGYYDGASLVAASGNNVYIYSDAHCS